MDWMWQEEGRTNKEIDKVKLLNKNKKMKVGNRNKWYDVLVQGMQDRKWNVVTFSED